jgi:hypothetical protein
MKPSMKKPSQKEEWSVEPVNMREPESAVAGLSSLLQTVDQHLVDLQTKLAAAANVPEQTIR